MRQLRSSVQGRDASYYTTFCCRRLLMIRIHYRQIIGLERRDRDALYILYSKTKDKFPEGPATVCCCDSRVTA